MMNKLEKHFDKIGLLVLGCFFICFNLRLFSNMDMLIDSDMASEMLYGNLMAKTGSLFLKDWYYSTAIQTVDSPLIYALLFLVFDNWHVVRIVATVILNIILLLCFVYLCKTIKIKHISWLALLILGTISNEYFDFVLKGQYYTPYLSMTFISTALLIEISKNKKVICVKSVLLMVISVLAGLNGLRQIAQCYACLFGTSVLFLAYKQCINPIWKKLEIDSPSFRMTIYSFISLVCSFIGYALNKVLLEPNFSFMADWGIKLELASYKRIMDIIYGWATMFGYETGQKWTLVVAVLYIGLILTAFVYIIKNHDKKNELNIFVMLLFIVSSLITLAIFVFTSMTFAIRYFIQVFMNCIFVIGVLITDIKFDYKKILICLVLLCMTVICSNYQIDKDVKNSTNNELIEIKNILLEENIHEGFGSFWNANVLTEMSDGTIDVWNFHNYEEDDDVSIKELDKWLQKKEHFERNPEGRVFIVLTYRQNEKIGFITDISDKVAYRGNERLMYIFDNYEELVSSIYG